MCVCVWSVAQWGCLCQWVLYRNVYMTPPPPHTYTHSLLTLSSTDTHLTSQCIFHDRSEQRLLKHCMLMLISDVIIGQTPPDVAPSEMLPAQTQDVSDTKRYTVHYRVYILMHLHFIFHAPYISVCTTTSKLCLETVGLRAA